MKQIRIGMMGFGRVGRQIYEIAKRDPRLDMVAISDIGQPKILHHLLQKTMSDSAGVALRGNYLVEGDTRTRLMTAISPAEVPWDVFDVDVVIDATRRFNDPQALQPYLDNGAPRVLMTGLPQQDIDRVVLYGVNEDSAQTSDRLISAGSASTTATALALKVICSNHSIKHASLTSVHAYTSDQSLQDYAGADYRRSRSGAENIIPNDTPAPHWVAQALPAIAGKLSGYALNVPVQNGSMIDLTMVLDEAAADIERINALYRAAALAQPELVRTTDDPIVSSDVRGCSQSLLVDLKGTMKAGNNIIKLLAWHESLGHANRVLDLVKLYADLDARRLDQKSKQKNEEAA